MAMSAKPGSAISPSRPSAVIGTPSRSARFRPSDSGSITTNAPISSTSDRRITFIIRSVTILPDPMIATLVLPLGIVAIISIPALGEAARPDTAHRHVAMPAPLQCDLRPLPPALLPDPPPGYVRDVAMGGLVVLFRGARLWCCQWGLSRACHSLP